VHYLFQYAERMRQTDRLLEAFHRHALANAVGKVTAQALKERGVRRMIVPETERMGALIIEIAHYYERSGD
jgi:uroporphyrinogen-III synthase